MNIHDILSNRISRLAIRLLGAWAILNVVYRFSPLYGHEHDTILECFEYGLIAGLGIYFLITGRVSL